jgi:hypothetical protein
MQLSVSVGALFARAGLLQMKFDAAKDVFLQAKCFVRVRMRREAAGVSRCSICRWFKKLSNRHLPILSQEPLPFFPFKIKPSCDGAH